MRKPYQSDVRKKTLPFSETSKKLKALTAASIESALTASCRCSIRCCSKATENMVRTARQSFYAMNTSEQKQFLIDELLKNGVRTESSWRFQFFIFGKQVRFILFYNLNECGLRGRTSSKLFFIDKILTLIKFPGLRTVLPSFLLGESRSIA